MEKRVRVPYVFMSREEYILKLQREHNQDSGMTPYDAEVEYEDDHWWRYKEVEEDYIWVYPSLINLVMNLGDGYCRIFIQEHDRAFNVPMSADEFNQTYLD